jgi:hypothetical protein
MGNSLTWLAISAAVINQSDADDIASHPHVFGRFGPKLEFLFFKSFWSRRHLSAKARCVMAEALAEGISQD